MPRDGSNVYHYPTGIEGEEGQTIESAAYNSFLADVEQDLNLPRPIIAGGTGASNAADARAAFGAETATQIVTNFDDHVFVAGSFSAPNASGSPVGGHAFAGIVYLADSSNIVLEARDLDDTSVPPRKYIRHKKNGVWTAWATDFDQTAQDTRNDGRYVNLTGDVMTGVLRIDMAEPAMLLDGNPGTHNQLQGRKNDTVRWMASFGDAAAEIGGNAGSNFVLHRYGDSGAYLGEALRINRNDSATYLNGSLNVSGAFSLTGGLTITSGYLALYGWASSNNQGVLFLNSTQDRYLHYDGTNYSMPSANVYAGNGRLWGSNDFSAPLPLAGGNMAGKIRTTGSGAITVGGTSNAIEVMSDGSAAHACVAYHIPGVFGTNMGLASDGNFYMGGWSHGTGIVYRFWTTRDTGQIIINTRLAYAGDSAIATGPQSTFLEPLTGAVITGWTWANVSSIPSVTAFRLRYLQVQVSPGFGWATVGYA